MLYAYGNNGRQRVKYSVRLVSEIEKHVHFGPKTKPGTYMLSKV